MEPSKVNKVGADSKPYDYPSNLRSFAEKLEIAARLLIEQIEKCDPVDNIGHKLTDNVRYREIQKLLLL